MPRPAARRPEARATARRPPRLVASRFTLTPRTLKPGAALGIRYRIDGTRRKVHARVDVLPVGSQQPAARIGLGWKRPGRTQTRKWTPPAGTLPPGDYVARLHAVDRRGRTLRRTAHASGRSALTVTQPPRRSPPRWRPSSAAGASRSRASTPTATASASSAAPRRTAGRTSSPPRARRSSPPAPASCRWRAYQAQGAGNYVVIDADDGRDFVFMHLLDGSVTVEKEATVSAGQVIGQVGQTGDATAPHLHFEIWPNGWYSSDDSQPVDPMPDLQAWAAAG